MNQGSKRKKPNATRGGKKSQEPSEKASNGAKASSGGYRTRTRSETISAAKRERKKKKKNRSRKERKICQEARKQQQAAQRARSLDACQVPPGALKIPVPSTLPLPTEPPPPPALPTIIIIPMPAPQTITLQSRRRRNMSHARTRRDGKPRAQTRHNLARSSNLWVRRRWWWWQRRQRASRVASDRVYRQASRRCDHLEGTSDLGVQLGVEEIVVRV